MVKRREFLGVSLEDLNRSWSVFVQGGHHVKSVHRTLWTSPPDVVLKLNFDGSFLHSSRRGGIGGIIRDWNGHVFRNFWGHVDSVSANEVEVYALMIGCHELLSLKSINAIIKGDSCSAIQMGFGESLYSLKIAGLGRGGARYL